MKTLIGRPIKTTTTIMTATWELVDPMSVYFAKEVSQLLKL
jgi:hypothetical protein